MAGTDSELKMVTKGLLPWKFTVMAGPREIAEVVDHGWWPLKGELAIEGARYQARRERVMSGAFVFESAGVVLARASKRSVLRRSFVIEHSGRHYTLRPKSAFHRDLQLLDGSTHLGSLTPESVVKRRANVDLPREWPLAIRVFVIWLAVMLWQDAL